MPTIPIPNVEVYCLVIAIAGGISWPFVRRLRLDALRKAAWRQMQTASDVAGQTGFGSAAGAAELAAYGGLIAAEYAWSWATIDPDVINAAAFSSTAPVNNAFDLVQYLHQHYDALGEYGKAGFTSRLVGYIGEQKAAGILLAQGHIVDAAHSATHPIWDLLVDHHPVNVKTVTDIAAIKAEALSNGHVTYLVPEDAHGHAVGNIEVLHGFTHASAEHAMHHAIEATHGETASHAAGMHLPWITAAFAVRRNWIAVQQGRDVLVAVNYGVAETIGRGGGGAVGAKMGGAIGLTLGPIGALVGAVIGGVGGALAGGAVAEHYKRKDLRHALSNLSTALGVYGSSFSHKLSEIADYVQGPVYRMRESLRNLEATGEQRTSRIMWWIWPDFKTVLILEAAKVGRSKIALQEQANQKLLGIIANADRTHDYKDVGLIMMNAPEVSELAGDNKAIRDRVYSVQQSVYYERRQLDTSFQPPS